MDTRSHWHSFLIHTIKIEQGQEENEQTGVLWLNYIEDGDDYNVS
jgi:hypothetical protein